jgi:murein peptide amidase A
VVVVGCIHGDEPAGIAVTRVLAALRPPTRVDLWLIPDMNPDGVAAGTRVNADHVDLNRNFSWRWLPPSRRADRHSGPRPFSEPESSIVHRLLLRLRPRLVIWYHQALAVVDESGGSLALERRYAGLVGLPLRRLPRYPGSATSWTNHSFADATSFVVELPPGPLSAAAARRHAEAVERLAAGLTGVQLRQVAGAPPTRGSAGEAARPDPGAAPQ